MLFSLFSADWVLQKEFESAGVINKRGRLENLMESYYELSKTFGLRAADAVSCAYSGTLRLKD